MNIARVSQDPPQANRIFRLVSVALQSDYFGARLWLVLRSAYLVGVGAAALYVVWTTIRTTMRMVTPAVYWDDWEWMTLLHTWVTDKFSWSSLFAVQNEHRIAFRRILQFGDYLFAQSTNWPLVVLNVVEYAATAIAFVALLRLANRAIDAVGLACYAGFILILIFCAPNLENLTWGAQAGYVPGFIGMTLAGLSLILSIRASHRAKIPAAVFWFWIAILVALAGTFSATGAVLIWPLLIVIGYWSGGSKQLLIGLMVIGASTVLFFFSDFHLNSDMNANPLKTWRNVATYTEYLPYILGNLVVDAQNYAKKSLLLGWFGLSSVAVGVLMFFRKPRTFNAAQLVLLAIVVFAVANALMISLSRQNWGGALAMVVDRYRILTATFWAAIAGLWLARASSAAVPKPIIDISFGLLSLVFIVEIVGHQRSAIDRHMAHYQRIVLANDALRVGVMDKTAIAAVGMPANFNELVQFFRERRLSVFADGRFLWVGQALEAKFRISPNGACSGAVEKVEAVQGAHDGWRASGWAWDNSSARVPSALLFTDASDRIIGLATGGIDGSDQRSQSPVHPTNWQGYFTGDPGTDIIIYGIQNAKTVCEIAHSRLP